jgi:protein SCO1/2
MFMPSWVFLAAFYLGFAGFDPAPCRLAVIGQAPDFELTTQDGGRLRSAELRGKVLLVSFIFTTCNGSCPATTSRLSKIHTELKARGLLGQDHRIRFVSISLDPARDTPAVLKNYMQLYDIEPVDWTFLTGDQDEVKKTLAAWGMWAKPAANGQLDHPSRVYLVDEKGRTREIYNLSFLKPAWVVEDIALLLER